MILHLNVRYECSMEMRKSEIAHTKTMQLKHLLLLHRKHERKKS